MTTAIKLNNSSARLVGNVGIPEGPFSIMGWFRLDTDPNAIQQLLALGGGEADWEDACSLSVRTLADGVTLEVRCFGPPTFPGPALALGDWIHIALAGDSQPGREVYLYLDGQLYDGGATHFGGMYFAHKIEMGNNAAGQFFRGAMASLKVWTRALSQEEIDIEADFFKAYNRQGLRQEFALVDPVDVFDTSGNNLHLTKSGTVNLDSAGPPIRMSKDVDGTIGTIGHAILPRKPFPRRPRRR